MGGHQFLYAMLGYVPWYAGKSTGAYVVTTKKASVKKANNVLLAFHLKVYERTNFTSFLRKNTHSHPNLSGQMCACAITCCSPLKHVKLYTVFLSYSSNMKMIVINTYRL